MLGMPDHIETQRTIVFNIKPLGDAVSAERVDTLLKF